MSNIKIYNKDWNDDVELYINKKILIRKTDSKDCGKYILNDFFLLIEWDKWGKEYFYSQDNKNYYQITNNNIFNLNISTINVVDDNNIYILYIDIDSQKIYKGESLEMIGKVELKKDILIIKNDIFEDNVSENKYIYFNFKYYQYSYFEKLFEIINIDNKSYLLKINSNIFYEENNIFKKGIYQKYKNKIRIQIDNIDNIYVSTDYKNYNIKYYDIYDDIKKIKNTDYENAIFFVIDLNSINDLIYIFNFYNNYEIKYIIIDNIINKNKNKIYNDLEILYYDDVNEINNYIKKYNINNLYIYTYHEKKFDKINALKIYNNYNLLDQNIDKSFLIKKWNELNFENLNKYEYLLNISNEKIPPIIHFIWVGSNNMPSIYINYIESWIKNHSDYIFCFWNDDNIPHLINQKYYDESEVYAMKADILRYELLYFFGGIYIDCDFLSIKNIDHLIKDYDGFSAYESEKYIAIGILGFKKYDHILLNIIKKLAYNIDENNIKKLNKTIPQLTGPIFFTEVWLKYKSTNHFSFDPNYFYSYKFTDKHDNKKYIVSDDNYAIHMWGYSWNQTNNSNKIKEEENEYYLVNYYLSHIILDIDCHINRIKYNSLSKLLRLKIYFKGNNNLNKKKIVHIMGMFFTGGIERYLYYIDKYGNHEIYEYYLLYISNDKYVYNIENMKMISFDWNHNYLNKLLITISPHLIIDHYSLYLNNNNDLYKNINRNNIIYFVHSAITYNNDITNLLINNCIHLYDEKNKHKSWKSIIQNYYLTLGTELNIYNKKKSFNEKENIQISIIGRIAEEKIPISFFKKLCNLSQSLNKISIHIYGEKDYVFSKNYVEEFDSIIKDSKIILHNFVNPLEMNKIYLETDVLLIPSIYETGSFTCIEAFSYGIPVISRNVYGLKYLITNKINGYLCDNEDIMLNKIKNIYNDSILLNSELIKYESLNYNIVDKIKELEIIINQNTLEKNIIIITSVLNCSNKELSYYPKRTVFTLKERYKHSINSIESIKKYLKNTEILYCECSDLSEHIDIEKDMISKVDYYFNFNDNLNVKNAVDSKLKGLGEAHLLLEAIEKIINLKKKYKNIFKLSGRYFLNNSFNFDLFNNDKNIFTNWDNSNLSYCTIFYKINMNDIYFFKYALLNSLEDLNDEKSIEYCIYKNFNKNIYVVNKVNISGYLSTEGYLFSI